MQIEIQTVYFKDDLEFGVEYHSVRIIQDGTLIKTYGDYYHDKGNYKSQGFVDAIKLLSPEVEIFYRNINHETEEYK